MKSPGLTLYLSLVTIFVGHMANADISTLTLSTLLSGKIVGAPEVIVTNNVVESSTVSVGKIYEVWDHSYISTRHLIGDNSSVDPSDASNGHLLTLITSNASCLNQWHADSQYTWTQVIHHQGCLLSSDGTPPEYYIARSAQLEIFEPTGTKTVQIVHALDKDFSDADIACLNKEVKGILPLSKNGFLATAIENLPAIAVEFRLVHGDSDMKISIDQTVSPQLDDKVDSLVIPFAISNIGCQTHSMDNLRAQITALAQTATTIPQHQSSALDDLTNTLNAVK